jgi:hypothetical protein
MTAWRLISTTQPAGDSGLRAAGAGENGSPDLIVFFDAIADFAELTKGGRMEILPDFGTVARDTGDAVRHG